MNKGIFDKDLIMKKEKLEKDIIKEVYKIELSEREILDILGNCCQDETEQCIGCGVCLRDECCL